MLLFILSCSMLALLVAGSLWLSMRRRSDTGDLHLQAEASRRLQNLAIARERLDGLDSQADDDPARLELESSLADDLGTETVDRGSRQPERTGRTSATLLLVALPLVAALLYSQLGDTTWIRQAGIPTPAQIRDDPERSLATLLTRLEQTLQEEPDNPAGWALAGRTYLSLGRNAEAEKAFAEANRLQPDDADLLTAWADATLLTNNNQFSSDVESRVLAALKLDPNHANALWVAGMGFLSRQQNDQGLVYLRRLRPLLAAQPEVQQQIDLIIAQAAGTASIGDVQAAAPRITINVTVSASLRTNLDDEQVVFVFARAQNGPRFPLAAARLSVADLPATVTLDESSAMIEGQTIANFDQVEVIARVSLSGQPVAAPGDLSSGAELVQPGEQPTLSLVIDEVVK